MREKQFTLSRSQREAMWRRFKQTDDRRVAERLHAILLLDDGQNAQSVCSIDRRTPASAVWLFSTTRATTTHQQ